MRSANASIAKLMAFIALVAINFAFVRFTMRLNQFYWFLPLAALAIQLGAVCLARGRGRSRAFWAGFLGGALVAAGLSWAVINEPGSPVGVAFVGYVNKAITMVDGGPTSLRSLIHSGPQALGIATAVVFYLPHLALSVGGGILAFAAASVVDLLRFGGSLGGGQIAGEESRKPA